MYDGLVMVVLGVDPGKHTGLAVVALYHDTQRSDPTGLLPDHRVEFRFGTTVEEADRAGTVREYLMVASGTGNATVQVAAEKYVSTRRTLQSQDHQALEAIGAVKAVLELLGAPEDSLTLQLPSAANTVMTDERLAAMGLLQARRNGLDGHGKDALRHAVFRCVTYVRGIV